MINIHIIKNNFYRLFPLLLLIFIDSFSFFLIIPVLLKIFYHIHYDLLPHATKMSTRNSLTGMAIALAMFSALIAAPFVGNASDKYGRKKTLLFCIGCISIGFLFPIIGIIQKNIYLIFSGRVIAGVGSASQPVAQATVADLCKNEDKAIFLSLIAFMMTLALILGPLAGGFLSSAHIVSWFNIKTPFEFALSLSVINLLLIMFFFKETIQKNQKSEILSAWAVLLGFPALMKRYRFGFLILFFCCLELGWSQYYQSISLFLHLQFHYSVEKISVFNASMGVIMLLGLVIVYPLLLRFFSVKNIMRYCMLFVLIGLSACTLFPFKNVQWIFSELVAICTGCAYVSLVALISNQTPDDAQGFVMGYLSTILYFAWMMTSLDSGFFISLHRTLPLLIAAFFLAVGVFWMMKRICMGDEKTLHDSCFDH